VASPDGSLLTYVGTGDEGTPQIFIAGIDGTGVRQMTHEPIGATSPAWSPDGTMIAYARIGSIRWEFTGLFVLDVATGESTQVTVDSGRWDGLQLTPDGASLLYNVAGELRTVPIAGGSSTLLIGPEGDAPGDLVGAGNGSLSPDGSLVTFNGPTNDSDVGRWVANADGTGRRALPGCYDAIPAGTWSPDGSRIVCNESLPPTYAIIMVIDVATGDAGRVASGVSATWLDDHTLLVEV
jgi:Tol biopolymer transport system component